MNQLLWTILGMTYGLQKLYILFVCLFVCLCRPSFSFRSAKEYVVMELFLISGN